MKRVKFYTKAQLGLEPGVNPRPALTPISPRRPVSPTRGFGDDRTVATHITSQLRIPSDVNRTAELILSTVTSPLYIICRQF